MDLEGIGHGQSREVILAGRSFPEGPFLNPGQWTGEPEMTGKRLAAEHRLVTRRQTGESHSLRLENGLLAGPASKKRLGTCRLIERPEMGLLCGV